MKMTIKVWLRNGICITEDVEIVDGTKQSDVESSITKLNEFISDGFKDNFNGSFKAGFTNIRFADISAIRIIQA